MKSVDKLVKLAVQFEGKLGLVKQGEEVDSTILTLSIRPKVNALLETYAPRFAAVMQALGDGDLVVGDHFFTTAKLTGGRWVVDPRATRIQVSGSQAQNPRVVAVVNAFNAAAGAQIGVELNRIKGNLQGDTITNHDSWVSKKDYAF